MRQKETGSEAEIIVRKEKYKENSPWEECLVPLIRTMSWIAPT